MLTRRHIYTLLIIISAGLMLGRIAAVNRTDSLLLQQSRFTTVNNLYNERAEQLTKQFSDSDNANEEQFAEQLAELETRRQQALENEKRELPFFSANDRSRWNTIRVLVEPEMRVQRTLNQPDGTTRTETVWYAIDKAQNVRGWDTIDMVKHNMVNRDQPNQPEGAGYLYSSKPPLLPTLMAIPYAVMHRASDGEITLAEHPHLVVRVTLVICNLIPLIIGWFVLARLIERLGITDWGRVFCIAFICFGTFLSTFAVTLNNHIPGMVSVAIAFYCAVRIVYDQETRWRYFVLAGLFSAFAVACEKPALLFCGLIALWLFWNQWSRTLFLFVPAALLVASAHFATNYIAHQTVMPAYSQQDWYFYEYERGGVVRDSYWKNPSGFDRGEECQGTYAFNMSVGHHGLFSLTPIWILSFIGLGIWLLTSRYRSMALFILLTSVVVFAFYVSLPQELRNYGGNTSALRWMFWLAPLWSVALVAAADQFSRFGITRAIALLCLALSVMSAAYPTWNPWTMPWLYNLLQYVG